jgi:predicted nucleotidyltransferase
MGYTLPNVEKRRQELMTEVRRIVDVLKSRDVESIILFGSLARGDIGSHSDIDLIVIENTDKRFLERLDSIYSAVVPRRGLDVLVYTPEEMTAMSRDSAFVRKALAEGVVLYAKDSP